MYGERSRVWKIKSSFVQDSSLSATMSYSVWLARCRGRTWCCQTSSPACHTFYIASPALLMSDGRYCFFCDVRRPGRHFLPLCREGVLAPVCLSFFLGSPLTQFWCTSRTVELAGRWSCSPTPPWQPETSWHVLCLDPWDKWVHPPVLRPGFMALRWCHRSHLAQEVVCFQQRADVASYL